MHGREVQHDSRAAPVEPDVGLSVEHSAQGPVEELPEGVHRRLDCAAQLISCGPRPGEQVVARVGERCGEIGEGGLAAGASIRCTTREVERRPADDCVLHRRQVASEDSPDKGDHQRGLTPSHLLGVTRSATRSGVEGVESSRSAGVQVHDGETERVGERPVLALRVGDGDPPSEHPATAVDEALGGGRLPGPRLPGEEDVRVGDQTRPVRVEGVVGEAPAAREDVGPEVGAARGRAGLRQQWIGRAEMGRRRPVPGKAQRAADPHPFHRRARPRATGRAQTRPRS